MHLRGRVFRRLPERRGSGRGNSDAQIPGDDAAHAAAPDARLLVAVMPMTGREYAWKRRPGWWLRNRRYLMFQLREAGGVVCALYGLVLLNMLVQLRAGESAYTAFLDLLRTPPVLYLNVVLFALVVWHALTWFMLIGKAQPIQFTRQPLPWKVVFGINVLLWLGVSGAVVYLIFGGI